MNNAVMAKDNYPTTVLAGIYRITGEKETVKKERQKVPDVSNAVALIISSATRNFPVLEKVSENKSNNLFVRSLCGKFPILYIRKSQSTSNLREAMAFATDSS